MKLKNKVALVTGGSRGIGQAIAIAFAREGANVIVAARTSSELNNAIESLKASGAIAIALTVDVSKPPEVERMVYTAMHEFERIDILVNCAGMFGPIGPLVKNDIAKWIQTINVNLLGTVLCCKAVLPFMISNRYGKIINLSGGGAADPHPNFSAYGTSKAAVVRFTETIAQEVKPFNVDANAISPGGINTRLQDEVIAAGELAGVEGLATAKKIKETGGTPIQTPVSLAVFLASHDSDGITGKLISAVWDDWQSFGSNIEKIANSDLYTLRRITR